MRNTTISIDSILTHQRINQNISIVIEGRLLPITKVYGGIKREYQKVDARVDQDTCKIKPSSTNTQRPQRKKV